MSDFDEDLITELAHAFAGTGVKVIRFGEDGPRELDLDKIVEATTTPDRYWEAKQELLRGQGWILIDENSGDEMPFGETLRRADGEESILRGGQPPHKPSSTGRIYVYDEDAEDEFSDREYFPSVFDLKWVYNKELKQ